MSKPRSKSKSKSTLSDDQVYTKFIEFLQSANWCMPVLTFLEQRSIVFDKDQGDEDIYRQSHTDYRCMVDMLIECFCEDIGIQPSGVSMALRKSTLATEHNQEELQALLEPVLAAQDFNLFIHLMTRKNIELQLQALQMIEYMSGAVPTVLISMKALVEPTAGTSSLNEEELILRQIMEASREEYERDIAERNEESQQLETAVKLSLVEREKLADEVNKQQELTRQVMMLAITDGKEVVSKSTVAVVDNDKPPPSRRAARPASGSRRSKEGARPASAKPPGSDKARRTSTATVRKPSMPAETIPSAEATTLAPQDVAARQEYMRTQRDKLLRLKAEAREKAFNAEQKKTKQSTARPKTAQAARKAMRGQTSNGRRQGDVPNDDVLRARRALAAKLKAEVILSSGKV